MKKITFTEVDIAQLLTELLAWKCIAMVATGIALTLFIWK